MSDINRQIMAAHRELDAFVHDGSSGVALRVATNSLSYTSRIQTSLQISANRQQAMPSGIGGSLPLPARHHAIWPALASHRPACDVRDHHLGDVDVVVEHLGLGGTRGRIQHLVRVGQLHPADLFHHAKGNTRCTLV